MLKEALSLVAALATSPLAAWRVVIVLIMAAIAYFAGQGYARASDAQDKIGQLDARLGAIETKQDIALRIALADEICRLYALRAANVENLPLWRTLDDTFRKRQEDYRAVNSGDEYDTGQCSAPR